MDELIKIGAIQRQLYLIFNRGNAFGNSQAVEQVWSKNEKTAKPTNSGEVAIWNIQNYKT